MRPKKLWYLMILRVIAFDLLALLASALLTFMTVLAIFFLVPEVTINGKQIHWLLSKTLPASLRVEFSDFSLHLDRPAEGRNSVFRKTFSVDGKDLCLKYGGDASISCFALVHISGEIAWRHKIWPEVMSVSPLDLLGGRVLIDFPKLPLENTSGNSSMNKGHSLDITGFLREQILKNWHLAGSVIEMESFRFRPAAGAEYFFKGDLRVNEFGEAVLNVREFRDEYGPLRGSGQVRIMNPTFDLDFQGSARADFRFAARKSMRVDAGGQVRMSPGGDRSITGQVSIQAGGQAGVLANVFRGGEIKALEISKCAFDLNFDKSAAGLKCGPKAFRLSLAKNNFGRRHPEFFQWQPEVDLRIKNVDFGETKKADFALGIRLDQSGIFKLQTELSGMLKATSVSAPGSAFGKGSGAASEQKFDYQIAGGIHFTIEQFKKLVRLLHLTPYAVPAPFNELSGKIGVDIDAAFGRDGEQIRGTLASKSWATLDSANQAAHLRFDSETRIERRSAAEDWLPVSRVTLSIDKAHLSAPRFDLRAPPPFKPDARFGPIREMARAELGQPRSNAVSNHAMRGVGISRSTSRFPIKLDLQVHVLTTSPQAIRITTNLTQAPIPVDLDLTYVLNSNPAPLTGSVVIGRTPVNLFKRNAVLDGMRIELLASGERKIRGRVNVTYLDYNITMVLAGLLGHPQIRFMSDPPLEDNQILAAFLFGRPLNQLGDDQKTSVSNLGAAFADAALSISSLYLLASTPIESLGYDPDREVIVARMGLGGGTTLELGGGIDSSTVGIRKRLSQNFIFSSDVETVMASGKRTVLALIEWVKRF